MVCVFCLFSRELEVADWLRMKWNGVDGLISPMTKMIGDYTSFIAVELVIRYQAGQCRGGPFSFLLLASIICHPRIDRTSDQ
jgi:hypothetical protein